MYLRNVYPYLFNVKWDHVYKAGLVLWFSQEGFDFGECCFWLFLQFVLPNAKNFPSHCLKFCPSGPVSSYVVFDFWLPIGFRQAISALFEFPSMPEIPVNKHGALFARNRNIRSAERGFVVFKKMDAFAPKKTKNFNFGRGVSRLYARHYLAPFFLCKYVRHWLIFAPSQELFAYFWQYVL